MGKDGLAGASTTYSVGFARAVASFLSGPDPRQWSQEPTGGVGISPLS